VFSFYQWLPPTQGWRLVLQLARDMSDLRLHVRTATTAIIPMRVHHTATMVPNGFLVVSLSVLARGTEASTDAVSTDLDSMSEDGMAPDVAGMDEAFTDALLMATMGTAALHTDRLAAASVVASHRVVSTADVGDCSD
jgi:hypothetical protein